MRVFSYVFITVSLMMLLLYANSFILHDRNFFVPPPENVSEGFVKMLEARRFELAVKKLSQNSPYKSSVDSLEDWQQMTELILGEYMVFGGKSRFIGESKALANVRLKGISGESWPVFQLVKEQGLWKIDRIAE